MIQNLIRLYLPVSSHNWMAQIPECYREAVLNETKNKGDNREIVMTEDPHCLALLKNYELMMPLAKEAHKPIFYLKPADGAMGGYHHSVLAAYKEFKQLALNILKSVEESHGKIR